MTVVMIMTIFFEISLSGWFPGDLILGGMSVQFKELPCPNVCMLGKSRQIRGVPWSKAVALSPHTGFHAFSLIKSLSLH